LGIAVVTTSIGILFFALVGGNRQEDFLPKMVKTFSKEGCKLWQRERSEDLGPLCPSLTALARSHLQFG
jgi:hypothetical protein